MAVKRTRHHWIKVHAPLRIWLGRAGSMLLAVVVVCAASVPSAAQTQSQSQIQLQVQPGERSQTHPSSAVNAFYGSVTVHPASDETLRLSLDDAIHRGLENNLGLKESEASEKAVKGEKLEAMQLFLPNIRLDGSTAFHQTNLAAMGFGPDLVAKLGAHLPGGFPKNFSFITRADVTQGNIVYKQTLFSGPVVDVFRGTRALARSAHFARMTARGEVVQQVATAYLASLAATSQVENAKALETADHLLLDQAHAKHEAGVVANLDELRARVQLQSQQQQVISAENALAKDLILLKREIGIDPGQPIELTDPTPYSDLATLTPEEVRAEAYRNRQDYQNLKAQIDEAAAERSGYKHQRWPTLSFKGNYAVTDVSGVGTHGNFAAVGTLSVPIFREASLRGDVDVAEARLSAANAQFADLTSHIDQQVRSALLDVDATSRQVKVARSNVDLATRALTDETDRVHAGIDDNLPLVQAQATLAAAENHLVQSLYQYNLAKLVLARASGIIETQYRVYLGTSQ